MKKSLISLALLYVSIPTLAGTLKIHDWETTSQVIASQQDICSIDVLVDVGFYIIIYNQNPVTLAQTSGTNNYQATFSSPVIANFDAQLNVIIEPSGDVEIAELTAEILGSPYITANILEILKVSIKANGVEIENLTGGVIAQKIADLIITVVPGSPPEIEE